MKIILVRALPKCNLSDALRALPGQLGSALKGVAWKSTLFDVAEIHLDPAATKYAFWAIASCGLEIFQPMVIKYQ